MSRHSRTSAASTVLKLCNDVNYSYSESDMEVLRNQVLDCPDISEEAKDEIIDLVTVVILRHELYRMSVHDLQAALDSKPIDVNLEKID